MAPSTGSREDLNLPAERQSIVTSRIPGIRRWRGMLAGPPDAPPAPRRRARQPGGGAGTNTTAHYTSARASCAGRSSTTWGPAASRSAWPGDRCAGRCG